MAVAITRTDLSAEELRGARRRTKDSDQACRPLALALVLHGASRMAAAGMPVQRSSHRTTSPPSARRPMRPGRTRPRTSGNTRVRTPLALRVRDDHDAIVEARRKAWNDLLARPHRLHHPTKLGQRVMTYVGWHKCLQKGAFRKLLQKCNTPETSVCHDVLPVRSATLR